ncbi:MAG: hypothetical protein ACYC35_28615 [Pirellulales bacterium]
MGTTYRFVAAPSEPSEVMAWFRRLDTPPVEAPAAHGVLLYFKEFGRVIYGADGSMDPKASPIATVFLPHAKRGVLWTVGEVHFLATPLRQLFPGLHKISSAFSKWLAGHQCVYSHQSNTNTFDYYLEGSIRNNDSPVFAFASGLSALTEGRYFVADGDNEHVLARLCQSLRLRGVECADA